MIKIKSLTYFPLLIYCGVGDLRKLHYGSHVNNLVHNSMKKAIAKLCY